MKLFLGIDGGQTATKSILADEFGRVLGTGRGGPAIHLKDAATRQHARRALFEAVHEALTRAGLSDSAAIESAFLGFTGISGSGTEAARTYCEVVQEQFSIGQIGIDHDACTALAGAIPSMVGVIAIAGTGSIAFGMNALGERARAGGWGYLLGDPGSAYEMGREAIAAVGEAHDGTGPPTSLTLLVLQALGIDEPGLITRAVYQDPSPKLRIASVSPVVSRAAETGDAVAKSILDAGGRKLGLMAGAVALRLRPAEPNWVFSAAGGVMQAGELIWRPYRVSLQAQFPASQIVAPEFSPLVGALLLALKQSGVNASRRVREQIACAMDSEGR